MHWALRLQALGVWKMIHWKWSFNLKRLFYVAQFYSRQALGKLKTHKSIYEKMTFSTQHIVFAVIRESKAPLLSIILTVSPNNNGNDQQNNIQDSQRQNKPSVWSISSCTDENDDCNRYYGGGAVNLSLLSKLPLVIFNVLLQPISRHQVWNKYFTVCK